MNKQTIGTCGNCGGAVTVDTIFFSVIPPTPRCEGCGATPVEAHGPVIPMNPAPVRKTWIGTSTGASNLTYELLGNQIELNVPNTTSYNYKLSVMDDSLREKYLFGTWENLGEDGELQEP